MKPVISQLLKHNGKMCLLPIPPRYLELLECVRVLDLKDEADEDDITTLEYRSLIGAAPTPDAYWKDVDDAAACLSKLTPEQLDTMTRLCAAFNLTFDDVGEFFNYLSLAKGVSLEEIQKSGIPAAQNIMRGDEK